MCLFQTGLLSAGYIPSKTTFGTILQALALRTDTTMRRKSLNTTSEQKPETFQFLLFVFDILEQRKLTVDSSFYSAALILGAQDGALHKRIAYYMSEGRRRHKEMTLLDDKAPDVIPDMKWEELLLNYSAFKEQGDRNINLPLIRVSSNDFGRVLAAEQTVNYRPSLNVGR